MLRDDTRPTRQVAPTSADPALGSSAMGHFNRDEQGHRNGSKGLLQ